MQWMRGLTTGETWFSNYAAAVIVSSSSTVYPVDRRSRFSPPVRCQIPIPSHEASDLNPLRMADETAGPSTALRSGRDDNSVGFSRVVPATELSSRPERSAVEGPAVSSAIRNGAGREKLMG